MSPITGSYRWMLLLAAALLFAVCPCRADDGSISAVGGTVKLMRGHPSVVMRSERVRARLGRKMADVECIFVFENTGPATDVLMGFPESGWGDDAKQTFDTFQAYVDGKPVPVKKMPGERDENSYETWWVKSVPFAAGQIRQVRDVYRAEMGAAIGMGPFKEGYVGMDRLFEYVLATGGSWKGKIGSADVSVDLGPWASYKMDITPKGSTRTGSTLTWRWENLKPTDGHDISVAIHEPPHKRAAGAPAPKPPAIEDTGVEWIIKASDVNALKEEDLRDLSLSDLRLARNEIYARHGAVFHTRALRLYFAKRAWYQPVEGRSPEDVTLSALEKKNIEVITRVEKAKRGQ